MRHTILSVVFVLVATLANAQLYHAGERLDYRVAYKARLVPNTEMATVTVSTDLDTLMGRKVFHVVGHGRIMPEYRWFFNLDDRYDIWADTVSLRTLRFESDIVEGSSYTFRSNYRYDWDSMRVHTWAQKRQRTPRIKTLTLTERSMDPVSLYFNLRSVDLDSFHEGDHRELEMVLDDTIKVLHYRFIARETKRVPGSGKFRTLRFACTLGTSEGFSFTDGTEFHIWITDDDNKIPVFLESPIKVGSIRAYMSGCKGLKYPLTSKIK